MADCRWSATATDRPRIDAEGRCHYRTGYRLRPALPLAREPGSSHVAPPMRCLLMHQKDCIENERERQGRGAHRAGEIPARRALGAGTRLLP